MKKKRAKDTIYLGKRQLSFRMIDYFLDPYKKGAWCQACDGEGNDGVVHIGLDHENWENVLENIVHEAHEFSLCDLGASYKRNNQYVDDSSDCVHFMFNHELHTEACGRTAHFMAQVVDETRREWNKLRPKGL